MKAFWELFLSAYGVAWLLLVLAVAVAAAWIWFDRYGGDE